MARKKAAQTKAEQPKTFAEYALERHRKACEDLAASLVWQITNCGVENIHTYSTAQSFLRAYEMAGAWAAVVQAEKGTP